MDHNLYTGEFTLWNPEFSEWTCHLFGHPGGIAYRPLKGQEPCWFHRQMQEIILGHRWVKDATNKNQNHEHQY